MCVVDVCRGRPRESFCSWFPVEREHKMLWRVDEGDTDALGGEKQSWKWQGLWNCVMRTGQVHAVNELSTPDGEK